MFLLLSRKMKCDCDVVDWRCYTERTQVARSVTVLNTTRGSTIWWQSVYLFSQPAHPTVWSDLWFPTILKPSSMLHWKSAVGKSTQVDTKDTFQRRLANEMSSGTSVADQPQTVLWLVTGPRGTSLEWSKTDMRVERWTPRSTATLVSMPRASGGITPYFTPTPPLLWFLLNPQRCLRIALGKI